MPGGSKFIGGIRFGISVSTALLAKGLRRARRMIRRFSRAALTALKTISGFGVTLANIGFAKFTSDTFAAIDSLAKISDKLGVTTEALAGLRLAAEETGAGARTLDMGLQRMLRRVSEAAQGTGEARAALKELGLSAKRLNLLTPDEQFRAIAGAMAKVEAQSDKVRLAFKLFDSEGVALVNTLNLGRAGLDEAAEAAKALGLAVDRASARGVERAIDSFNRFKSALLGIFRSIAIEIAPLVELITKGMTNFLTSGGRVSSAGKAIGRAVVTVAKLLADTVQKMYAAILRFAASGIELFHDIRGSYLGGKFGLTPAPKQSFDLALDLRRRADSLVRRENLPSTRIDKLIDDNVTSTVDDSKKQVKFLAFDIARGLAKGVKGSLQDLAATPGQLFRDVTENPINRFLGRLAGRFFRGLFTPPAGIPKGREAAHVERGRLTFSESGSAESFNARAENRRIRENQKMDLKRNALLQSIADNTANTQVVAVEIP